MSNYFILLAPSRAILSKVRATISILLTNFLQSWKRKKASSLLDG